MMENDSNNNMMTHTELEKLPETDFSVIEHNSNDELFAFRINEGEFKDFVFSFKDIEVNEEEWENDNPIISFDFDILTFPSGIENFEESYKDDKKLHHDIQATVTKIFMKLITDAAEKAIDEHA